MDAQELTVPSYEQPQPPLLCCCCASRTMCDATCHQFWLATCSLTDSRISFSSGKVATSMGTAGRVKKPLHHFIAISSAPGMCFCRAAAHRLHASGWQSAALGCAGMILLELNYGSIRVVILWLVTLLGGAFTSALLDPPCQVVRARLTPA